MENNLDKINLLHYIDDIFYIVEDNNGKIIDAKSADDLKFYKDMLINCIAIENKNDGTIEYYIKDINEWFEYVEKVIDNKYKLKLFKKITKFKIREKSLQIDSTTGLVNKKLADKLLNGCISESIKNGKEFAVIFCDIDYFKKVNDIYGHECGDIVLESIGKIFRSNIRQKHNSQYEFRPLDIAGRHGGEEFLIVLRNISHENTIIKAELLRSIISDICVEYNNQNISVTMSLGVYHVDKNELSSIQDIDSFRTDIMKKADIAMYYAKNHGRNRTVLYENGMTMDNDKIKVYN